MKNFLGWVWVTVLAVTRRPAAAPQVSSGTASQADKALPEG